MSQFSSSPSGNGYSGNGPVSPNGSPERYSPSSRGPSGIERLRALLSTLWVGKWLMLAVFFLLVGAAAAYTYTRVPQYQTSTSLLVDLDRRQSAVPALTGERGGSSVLGGQRRTLSNQVYLLNRSDALAQEVARRLDTMDTHPQTGEPLSLLRTSTGERRSLEGIMGVVQGRVQARAAGREVDAIKITATGPVPAEAALVANQFAAAYIDRTREKGRESLTARRRFLERQAQEYDQRVSEANSALSKFMQREDAVSLDQRSSRLVQQQSELEARRNQLRIKLDMAESTLDTKRSELERIRPRLAERLSSGTQSELKQVQEEKAAVEAEINRIRARRPDLDPDGGTPQAQNLRTLRRQAERLKQQADSLADTYVERTLAAGGISASPGDGEEGGGGGLSRVVSLQREIAQKEIQVNGLRAQLQTIEQRIAENRTQLQNLPPKSLRLAQLKSEKQSLAQIRSFVKQKLQETQMAAESEMGFAEQVERAGIPGRPISPNTRRNLLLAVVLALLLGGGLVVLRERLDNRIRVPGDLEALGGRVIGVIPSMESTIETKFRGQDLVEIEEREVAASLILLTSPVSAAAEAYRRLRTNLRYARPDAEMNSIVVTSPRKGEGKTTTAANLALAQARAGQETLLIDADLRESHLHRYFDVSRTPGLTEALYDGPDPADLPAPVDRLRVLPCGGKVPNPGELLGAQRTRRLIGTMERAFDVVIVDTAPVVLFNDPTALAAHADGVLLVASANETEGPSFKHAASLLDEVETARLGAVLNRFQPEQQRAGYGYGYSYSYGYGYGYDYGYGDEDLQAYGDEGDDRRGSFVADRVRAWWKGE